MSKIKFFSCHKNVNYASQCLEKKKGRGKTQTTTSTKMQLDDFASKFDKDFSLVLCLCTNIAIRKVLGNWCILSYDRIT
jgi:hypothetical protein